MPSLRLVGPEKIPAELSGARPLRVVMREQFRETGQVRFLATTKLKRKGSYGERNTLAEPALNAFSETGLKRES